MHARDLKTSAGTSQKQGLFPNVKAAALLEHFLATPMEMRQECWLERCLAFVSFSLEQLASVEAFPLPLFNTAPVVNIVIF